MAWPPRRIRPESPRLRRHIGTTIPFHAHRLHGYAGAAAPECRVGLSILRDGDRVRQARPLDAGSATQLPPDHLAEETVAKNLPISCVQMRTPTIHKGLEIEALNRLLRARLRRAPSS